MAKRGAFEDGLAIVRGGLVAGARARPDRRGRRGLPAPRHRVRDRRRLRGRARRADSALDLCEVAGGRRPGAGLRRLYGLRPARDRRLGRRRPSCPRSCSPTRTLARRHADRRRRRARVDPGLPRRFAHSAPAARSTPARRLAPPGRSVDVRRLRAAALAWLEDARRRATPRRPSTAASCSTAGLAARTATTRSRACGSAASLFAARGTRMRRARVRRRARAHRHRHRPLLRPGGPRRRAR